MYFLVAWLIVISVIVGRIQYVHSHGEPTGITTFKFNVVDRHGNALIDQTFLINVLGKWKCIWHHK